MNSLDDINKVKAIDSSDMYKAIFSFPDHLRMAAKLNWEKEINPDDYRNIKNIVFCGMGGSAIGADLCRSLLQKSAPCPMYVCRNYNLPGFAKRDSMVVGTSYSGNTEETLEAFHQAITRDCQISAITTGGKLGELAAEIEIPYMLLPGNLGLQPRAALGFSFVPLMMLLEKAGFSSYTGDDFLKLADFLEKRNASFALETDSGENQAKQLAQRFYGRIPIIYTGPERTDAVGTRLKGQINENAKMPAFCNQFPEFNHNELVGWKVIQSFREYLRVIILRDRDDHPRVAARMDIVRKLLEKQDVEVIELVSEGDNSLERIFSLIQLGDFTSYYLSILNNIDPTPVEVIEDLKKELAAIE